MADSINSPREHFVNNISVWDFDVPLQTQWVVRIAPKSSLIDFFNNILKYTVVDHSQLNEVTKYTHIEKFLGARGNALEEGLGLYFAQNIELPGESLDLEMASLRGDNGFLQGNLIKNRASGNKREFSIKLLETNLDFVDGLIRPWIIAAGYAGTCAIPNRSSIKCDIQVVQYTKGKDKPARKQHNFIDCVPYACDGSTLQYDQESVVVKNVSWIYNYYHYKLI
jgi:hypothetical protein